MSDDTGGRTLELWLVRHGETNFNHDARIQGQIDVPLNEVGRAQATRLGHRLGRERFDAVWASDLGRALETARIALPDGTIRADARLRELHAGRLEGRLHAELDDAEIAQLGEWAHGSQQAIGGGESAADMLRRVSEWLDQLPDAGRIVVVAHGGTIRAMLRLLLGMSGATAAGLPLTNGGITRVSRVGGVVRLEVLDDTTHLDGLRSVR